MHAGLASEGPLPSRRDIRLLVEELLEVLFPESHRLGTDGGDLRKPRRGHDRVAGDPARGGDLPGPAPPLRRQEGAARQVPAARARRHAPAAGRAAGDPRAAGQGRAGGVRVRPGGDRHRRDRRLLSRPVRDRDLPRGASPAARRRRGAAAHADRARALAHRHRHPSRRDHRRVVLHRPRYRHRRRRDHADRQPRAHLPGRDAGRAVDPRSRPHRQAAGQASATRRSRTT